jgi:hypothetical protein
MGASRLHQIADVLKVPQTFFFEGAPGQSNAEGKPLPDFVPGGVSTSHGLALARAYTRLSKDLKQRMRRAAVQPLCYHRCGELF